MTSAQTPRRFTEDAGEALDRCGRQRRYLVDGLGVTFTTTTGAAGVLADWHPATRTITMRTNITAAQLMWIIDQLWTILVLGDHHTTAWRRTRTPLTLIPSPRLPEDAGQRSTTSIEAASNPRTPGRFDRRTTTRTSARTMRR